MINFEMFDVLSSSTGPDKVNPSVTIKICVITTLR
jgi:transposase